MAKVKTNKIMQSNYRIDDMRTVFHLANFRATKDHKTRYG